MATFPTLTRSTDSSRSNGVKLDGITSLGPPEAIYGLNLAISPPLPWMPCGKDLAQVMSYLTTCFDHIAVGVMPGTYDHEGLQPLCVAPLIESGSACPSSSAFPIASKS
jgi:hypothetical protein